MTAKENASEIAEQAYKLAVETARKESSPRSWARLVSVAQYRREAIVQAKRWGASSSFGNCEPGSARPASDGTPFTLVEPFDGTSDAAFAPGYNRASPSGLGRLRTPS